MPIRSLTLATVVALLAGLLAASPAGAQSAPAVLEVTVVDFDGDPIEGFVVDIEQRETGLFLRELTGPDGTATFTDAPTEPTADYLVTVYDANDEAHVQEVTLTPGATTTLAVTVQGPPPVGELRIFARDRFGQPIGGIEGSVTRRNAPPFFFEELVTSGSDTPVTLTVPAGTYDVRIGWPAVEFAQTVEVVDDEVTVVTFDLPFPEPNDDFADATPLGPGTGDSGSFIGSTREPGEPPHQPAFPPDGSLWYTFTSPDAQLVTLSALSVDCEAFPVVAVYTGDAVDALTLVAVSDAIDEEACHPDLTFLATPGTTYRIALAADYFVRDASRYVLGLTVAPAPDSDGDGLLDADELARGTDPFDSDTDDDALADGTEVAVGTDPLDPDTDDDGLPDGKDVEHVQATIAALGNDAVRSPLHRLLLQAHLELVELSLRAGATWPAIVVLYLFHARIDGCGTAADRNDWVVDCDAQLALRQQIAALAAAIV